MQAAAITNQRPFTFSCAETSPLTMASAPAPSTPMKAHSPSFNTDMGAILAQIADNQRLARRDDLREAGNSVGRLLAGNLIWSRTLPRTAGCIGRRGVQSVGGIIPR